MKLLIQNPDDKNYVQAVANAVYTYAPNLVSKPNTEKHEIDIPSGKLTRLHGGGRADVYCFEFKQRRYCAKYFHDQRIFSRFKNAIGMGRAFSAYHKGLALMKMQINAPKVIGIAMRSYWAPPILIMEMIESFEQINLQLEHWKSTIQDLSNDQRLVSLASSFGSFTKNLHNNEIFHTDFSPRNVLMKQTNNDFDFYLIDLEDVLFSGESAHDIAHFEERLHRYLSPKETLQFMNSFYTEFNV